MGVVWRLLSGFENFWKLLAVAGNFWKLWEVFGKRKSRHLVGEVPGLFGDDYVVGRGLMKRSFPASNTRGILFISASLASVIPST